MAFTDRMKEARIKKDLTQEKLAKAIGVAKSTYTGYEKGNSEPNMLVLSKIMNVLGVDANFLFQDEMNMIDEVTATPYEMEHLVKKYRVLDEHGKEMVDGALEIEYKRYLAAEAEKRRQVALVTQTKTDMEAAAESVYYVLPMYYNPSSAGYGEEAGQDRPENVRLIKEPPRGTSYIAPVSGDSMEPTYHDGDLVFVDAQQSPERGEVGIFYMDGQQWIKELGDGVLISRNPAYKPRTMMEDIRCQGRVLGVCDNSYFNR